MFTLWGRILLSLSPAGSATHSLHSYKSCFQFLPTSAISLPILTLYTLVSTMSMSASCRAGSQLQFGASYVKIGQELTSGEPFFWTYVNWKHDPDSEMLRIIIATKRDLPYIRWQHCHRKTSKDERQSWVQRWIWSQFAKFVRIIWQFKHLTIPSLKCRISPL